MTMEKSSVAMPTPPAAGYLPQRPCSVTPEEDIDSPADQNTTPHAQYQPPPSLRMEKQQSTDEETAATASHLRGGSSRDRKKGSCCECCMYCCGIVLLLKCIDCMCD